MTFPEDAAGLAVSDIRLMRNARLASCVAFPGFSHASFQKIKQRA
jgi:hypothetical protein